ncbi:MAG TPA: glycosyltransferase family 2 protein [Methylomirabilota bacterium]|nr:glycosyltransferase family 2 protein [Methylomirabilota bacterium]
MTHPTECDVSLVIPAYDEAENVRIFLDDLFRVLKSMSVRFEVIVVNDGSRDQSLAILRDEAVVRAELKIIDFRRNFGQTAALMAGIAHSSGEVVVTMDADLQNDPADIPRLLEKIKDGYEVASGWRRERQDGVVRTLVSRVANRLISSISGVRLHDSGCTLKAYRRDVVADIQLYGEMHRFIPIYASWMGAKVTELPVGHRPRRFGRSKYGFNRIFKVLLDLVVIKFLDMYFAKPIHLFGAFGVLSLCLSGAALLLMVYWKVFKGVSMILTPMPVLAAMTFLVGCLSILMGLLAEILVRTYFESQGHSSYKVRELINFQRDA